MKHILKHTLRLLVVCLLPVTIISCGGGGGGGGGAATSPATHADLTISLAMKPPAVQLTPTGVKLNSIDITVHLPAGVVFTANSPDVVGVNNSTGQQNGQISGVTLDPVNRTVRFLVIDLTLPNGIEVSSFAKVRCSLSSTLDAAAFQAANGGSPLTGFAASGIIGSPPTSWTLTSQLTPTMSVSLY